MTTIVQPDFSKMNTAEKIQWLRLHGKPKAPPPEEEKPPTPPPKSPTPPPRSPTPPPRSPTPPPREPTPPPREPTPPPREPTPPPREPTPPPREPTPPPPPVIESDSDDDWEPESKKLTKSQILANAKKKATDKKPDDDSFNKFMGWLESGKDDMGDVKNALALDDD